MSMLGSDKTNSEDFYCIVSEKVTLYYDAL